MDSLANLDLTVLSALPVRPASQETLDHQDQWENLEMQETADLLEFQDLKDP